MKQICDIYKAVQFIEKNLKENITIEAAAQEAGYSLFHFARVFNQLTGHSPYDYIMRRRLSESAKKLAERKQRITDVAFEFQFNNIETYSRAFKKMFDILPNQIKDESILNKLTLKDPITEKYLEHITKNNFFEPEIIYKEEMCFLGEVLFRNDFIFNSFTIDHLRHELLNFQYCYEPELYTISFNPEHWQQETFRQLACIRVSSLEQTPASFVGKKLLPMQYCKFTHISPLNDVGLSYNYIFQTWLPKSGYRLSQPFSLEKHECLGYKSNLGISIFVPIIKK